MSVTITVFQSGDFSDMIDITVISSLPLKQHPQNDCHDLHSEKSQWFAAVSGMNVILKNPVRLSDGAR